MNHTTHPCLTDELLMAAVHGEAPEALAHARQCPACAARLAEEQALDGLLDELPPVTLAEESRVADVREALLDRFAAQRQRRGVTRWLGAAAALLLATTAYGALRSSSGDQPETATVGALQRGSVHDIGGARVVRHGNLPDEIVRVTDGAMLVEVQPLEQDERFRVVTGDAEIEVHGTVFEVRTEDDRLQSVRVLHGEVEVRFEDDPPVFLNDGERWTRPAPAEASAESHGASGPPAPPEPLPMLVDAPAAPAPTVAAAEPAGRTERVGRDEESDNTAQIEESRRAPRVGESDFVSGWQSLRAGEHAAAAEAFGRATRSATDIGLAEDAAYWQARALAESGSSSAAIRAWESFVSRFPASPRADEAAVHIGRARALEQRYDDARRWFERAADSADGRIREAAAQGLAEVEAGEPR